MKAYRIIRTTRSFGSNDDVEEATLSTRKKAEKFLKTSQATNCSIDYDYYNTENEIDKYDGIENYWFFVFSGCQRCGERCNKCILDRENIITTKDFDVKIPNLENNIIIELKKEIYFLDEEVYMYDYPLTLEVKSFKKDKEDALLDAIQKVKKWMKKNKKYIDKKTNWLDEKYRWESVWF